MSTIANACVDSNDFKTDSNGRLQLNPAFGESSDAANFSHPLNGTDGTYELITELAPVVVPRNGLYLVTWDAHGSVVVPPNNPGTPLNQRCMAALAIDGVFQPGTETMVCSVNLGGSPSINEVAQGTESTGSGSRVFQLTAGQQLRLMGAQDGNAGPTGTFIQSGSDGRSRITIVRIAS